MLWLQWFVVLMLANSDGWHSAKDKGSLNPAHRSGYNGSMSSCVFDGR